MWDLSCVQSSRVDGGSDCDEAETLMGEVHSGNTSMEEINGFVDGGHCARG